MFERKRGKREGNKQKERERKTKGSIMIGTKDLQREKKRIRKRRVGKEREAAKGREGKKVAKKGIGQRRQLG